MVDLLSEQNIVRYLLGELPEDEQVQIEERAFGDQKVLNEILAVEQDLIDDYVSGDIPAEKRPGFESHFLASEERRKKVAFARALATVVNESPARVVELAATPSWSAKLAGFFTRPLIAYSFAAASLVLFVVGAWLVVEQTRLRSELAQLRNDQEVRTAKVQQLEKDLADERLRYEELANGRTPPNQTPTQEIQHETPQPTTPTSPVTVALSLLPGISRSNSSVPHLSIAKDVSFVRLQIGIDPQESYQRYRVELRTEKGQQVLSQGNLTAHNSRNGKSVPLSVAAKSLAKGRYEVALKGITASGSTEDVGFYYFDVVKE